MKKTQFQLLAVAAFVLMVLTAWQLPQKFEEAPTVPEENLVIPGDINQILDNSCFGCHNVDAKSDKSKKKLLLDKLPNLSKAKIVAKLDEIAESVKENEMPPEKFLAKYPDKALTEEEAEKLIKWANSTAEEMLK